MSKFDITRKLGLIDYAHRSITLALFATTMAGAYTLGEGAYNIISKKYFPKQITPTPPPSVSDAK